jgi:ABC-2 type transport system ATP-binding protein
MIEALDVRKSFRIHRSQSKGLMKLVRRQAIDVEAVAGVSSTVGAGEMIGYVGPNGAGKSTTIKMLTGILQPSGGTVRVDGLDPARQRLEVARRIGVVFGQRSQLWWDLPLRESFELLRHIYHVPLAAYRERLAYLADLLELGSFIETPVRQLSLGQRMRGDLTAALLHAPPVLFLDEPSIGLDVVAKARIRDLLARINQDQGVTMLLTTHDMADIERLCSRMMIIDHGRVIYDGSLDAIREQYGDERTVVVDLEAETAPLEVPGAVVTRTDGPRQWLRFRRSETTAAQVIASVAASARLRDLTIEEPAIEDIVRGIYERSSQAAR